MSQFSRRSRWLNALFPASVAPQSSDPGSVSDDVSLVQPYDGSGWPIPARNTWITQILSVAGVNTSTVLLLVPPGFVYRLFAASVFNAVLPTGGAQLVLRDLISVPNVAVALAAEQATGGPTHGNVHFELNTAIVVPEGLTITGEGLTQGAGSVLSWSIYGALCPAGTVFYC